MSVVWLPWPGKRRATLAPVPPDGPEPKRGSTLLAVATALMRRCFRSRSRSWRGYLPIPPDRGAKEGTYGGGSGTGSGREAESLGPPRRLGPVAHAELAIQRAGVVLDRVRA